MRLSVIAAVLVVSSSVQAQNRIRFNEQDLFLSGGNVAWVNLRANYFSAARNSGLNSRVFNALEVEK